MAANAYSQTHLLLITGVIYVALGIEQVLAHVAEQDGGGRHAGGGTLSWSASVALYGGAALYLAGRLLFRRLTGQAVRPAQVAVAAAVGERLARAR